MELLLDTHALIWFINGDEQLSTKAKDLIQNINNTCYISIASIWEIAIKISIKRLDLHGGFDEISKIINDNYFEILPINFEHIKQLLNIEYFHRDPFDRIIISQSIVEKAAVVTKDSVFDLYPVNVIW